MTGTKQEDCESHISLGCTWGPGRSSVEGLPSVCKILNLSRRTTYKVITCTGWILLNPWCVRVYTDMMKYEVVCYMKKHVYDIIWNIKIIYMLYIKNACVLWFTKIGEIYWIIFSDIYRLYYSVYTSICMEVVTKSYTDYWFHVYWNYPMDILKPQKVLTTALRCMSLSPTALKFSLKLPSAGLGGGEWLSPNSIFSVLSKRLKNGFSHRLICQTPFLCWYALCSPFSQPLNSLENNQLFSPLRLDLLVAMHTACPWSAELHFPVTGPPLSSL